MTTSNGRKKREAEEELTDEEMIDLCNHQWQKHRADNGKTMVCTKCLTSKPNPFNGLQRHITIKYQQPYF